MKVGDKIIGHSRFSSPSSLWDKIIWVYAALLYVDNVGLKWRYAEKTVGRVSDFSV